jgi:dipeptidyl aminopeptidase/acylaminoacyl peptidase
LSLALLLTFPPAPLAQTPPQTVAEKSAYLATSRHADVVVFCEALAKRSPVVRLQTMGTSFEGRKLPLLLLADPPVNTPAEAAKSGKTVVLAVGNIHAGEVDGKEALLMLARDLATGKERALLKHLIVLIVPIFNADGNDKMGKNNRPGQNGPAEAGQRANAQSFDLNRDFVKLESPEVRALVRLLNTWDPAVVIDTHTTNGSRHRYAITYDGPRNPAGDDRLVTFVRDTLLPEVGRRMSQKDHLHSFFYGNFSADRQHWETYPALPRFGIVYIGLRNRIAILSESYTYAPFRARVAASGAFVRHCLEYIAANRQKVRAVLSAARSATVENGKAPRPSDTIVLRFRPAAFKEPATILGFVEETKDGKRVSTNKPKDYRVAFDGRCEPTLSVTRPYAYLYPASLRAVTENLQRHGIEVEELREDFELDVEAYRVNKVSHALRPFQKHNLASVEVMARKEARRIAAGTVLVRTAQPLGTLAAYLLEPQADDGLSAWNFFDAGLKVGADFPVLRLPVPVPLTKGRVRPLAEERSPKKPITLEALQAGRLPNFHGNPVGGLVWLDDGEHFLQRKEGTLLKVHAQTGRSKPFFDQEKFAKSLATIPGMTRGEAERFARDPGLAMNPQRTAALIEHQDDYYYCPFDGSKPVRLTKQGGPKELSSFSPDGKWVAFVRDNNLHVVDVATQTERSLTTDGSDTLSNGRADWVYFEEIFNRSRKAFWWSPDSTALAFLRFDDAPVRKFTLVDQSATRQRLERTRYPKAGDPNPRVKVGIVKVSNGAVRWAERGKEVEESTLIIHAGWTPDSRQVFFYVQDRAQTWLDFCTVGRKGGAPKVLFRDRTKAWVEDPGPPHFLKDGSFLFFSERSGWKHLYHLTGDGKLKRAVTSGEWEVHELYRVDEEGGWVYFSGTRDSPIANHLYRVKLDGSGLTRLTHGRGDHAVQVAPKGKLFVDTWSDHLTPPRVRLCRADGSAARTLDTNPVHVLDNYEFAEWEFAQIKTPDGFLLEGMVLAPPKLDPKRKYPVWFKTYGGPHLPTVRDTWSGGRVDDQALARAGYILFRCDPRSASGKGACSAWTAYRQLGVPELKDVEYAIRWLCGRPYVDAGRVGMSGSSYGGFLTAYALTHSKLFAAGVAGAPVTDWHNYDSIYTERYMDKPQNNRAGYEKTSVVKAAKNLHGRLLLLHGGMDDNVHVQNTIQLVDALQRADRDFEMMVYPRAGHASFGKHSRRLTLEFMQRTLRPQP